MSNDLFGGRIPDAPSIQKKPETDLGKLLDEEIPMPKEKSVIMDNYGGIIPTEVTIPMFIDLNEPPEDYDNFVEYD